MFSWRDRRDARHIGGCTGSRSEEDLETQWTMSWPPLVMISAVRVERRPQGWRRHTWILDGIQIDVIHLLHVDTGHSIAFLSLVSWTHGIMRSHVSSAHISFLLYLYDKLYYFGRQGRTIVDVHVNPLLTFACQLHDTVQERITEENKRPSLAPLGLDLGGAGYVL